MARHAPPAVFIPLEFTALAAWFLPFMLQVFLHVHCESGVYWESSMHPWAFLLWPLLPQQSCKELHRSRNGAQWKPRKRNTQYENQSRTHDSTNPQFYPAWLAILFGLLPDIRTLTLTLRFAKLRVLFCLYTTTRSVGLMPDQERPNQERN